MNRYSAYQSYDSTDFPDHWQAKRLRFAVKLNPSKNELLLSDSELVSFVPMDAVGEYGGIRLDEDKELAEIGNGYTYFRDNDVVVAKITPCFENGKGAIAKGLTNGCAFGTTELHVLRADLDLLDPDFLFYLTISDWFRDLGESEMYGAGGQKRVPEDFIKNLITGIPPKDEQQAIVGFLNYKATQIDELIAKKQSLLDKLTEQRMALVSEAVTKGLDPSVPMKDSGVDWLGEIPTHWKRVLLSRLIQRFEQGWSPSCEAREASQDEWGVLKSGCVNYGIFDERQHKTLPASLTPIESLEVKPGNILMCRASGSKHLIGSVARVKSCRANLIFSDKTYRISLNENLIDPDFFVFAMKSKYIREQIELSISGADGLANNIPQASVKSYQFVLPEIDEQRAIVKVLTEKSDRISLQEEKTKAVIERLQEYRSALITNAVTGKIDVRDFCIPTTTEQREVAHG